MDCPKLADFNSVMQIGFAMSFAFSILRDFVLRESSEKDRRLGSLLQLAVTIPDPQRKQEFLSEAKGIRSQIRIVDKSLEHLGTIFLLLLISSASACLLFLIIAGFSSRVCEPTVNIILALVLCLAPSPVLFSIFYIVVTGRYRDVQGRMAAMAADYLNIQI
jgi:hypothetical protein